MLRFSRSLTFISLLILAASSMNYAAVERKASQALPIVPANQEQMPVIPPLPLNVPSKWWKFADAVDRNILQNQNYNRDKIAAAIGTLWGLYCIVTNKESALRQGIGVGFLSIIPLSIDAFAISESRD